MSNGISNLISHESSSCRVVEASDYAADDGQRREKSNMPRRWFFGLLWSHHHHHRMAITCSTLSLELLETIFHDRNLSLFAIFNITTHNLIYISTMDERCGIDSMFLITKKEFFHFSPHYYQQQQHTKVLKSWTPFFKFINTKFPINLLSSVHAKHGWKFWEEEKIFSDKKKLSTSFLCGVRSMIY